MKQGAQLLQNNYMNKDTIEFTYRGHGVFWVHKGLHLIKFHYH
jgi:hypothetical protein